MDDDGNIFTAFLAEHNARRPVVNVVGRKRERFARLHHMLLKCVFVQNYEKGWHVATYMRRLLEEDEYPDEHIARPLETVFEYLDVVIAVCTYETQRDLKDCIKFCEISLEPCGIVYPILYKILAGCYLKLRQLDKAIEIVQSGLDFIMTNFKAIEALQLKQQEKKCLFVIRRLGDNTATHNFVVLYAFSSLLNLDVNERVQSFVEGRASPFEFKTLRMLIQTRFDCCYGAQLGQVLNQQMVIMSMNSIPTMKNYYKLMAAVTYPSKHVGAHCSILRVALNYNGWNDLIFVRGFEEVPLAFTTCPEGICCYNAGTCVNRPRGAETSVGLSKRRVKVAHSIGKLPRKKSIASMRCTGKMLVFYTKTLVPLLEQVIRHMRLDCELLILYHELLDDPEPVYRLFVGMESASIRILGLPRRCAMMMRGHTTLQARRILRQHMRLLCKRMVHWRNHIHVFVRCGVAKCIPKQRIQSVNELLCVMRSDAERFYASMRFAFASGGGHLYHDGVLHALQAEQGRIDCVGENNNEFYDPSSTATAATTVTKGTQTSYSKFSCRAKQTQTDKYFPEEVSILQQIAALEANLAQETAKTGELELRVGVMKEAKTEYMDNHNRTVKTLKRDVGQARRTILEKNQEISQQRTQIEQLQTNLSKLNKSYSHVVKPPEDTPKYTKNIIKENEKLQVMNANIIAENDSLQKQLAALTEEFDNMKASRDKLADENRELEAKFKQKSDQYDELYGMSCLNVETEEKLKQQEEQSLQIKTVIRSSVKECTDAFIEKIANYRLRCERIYEELTCFFYSCTPNLNNKQMCEANQIFLASLARQLDRNMQLIMNVKENFTGERNENMEALVTRLNWKDFIIHIEEFCTAIFNQYVQSLNTIMLLHTALNHALIENARLINQNRTASSLMEPENLCRPHFHQSSSYTERGAKVPLQPVSPPATFGAIGSNRPHNSWSSGVRSQPSDIQDPNTKNILSQIAHAVNCTSNLSSCANSSNVGGVQNSALDPSQGVIRRSSANPSPSLDNHNCSGPSSAVNAASRLRIDAAISMKENYGTSPDGIEFSNAKYKEIFLAIKKRFPTALRNDLINALNFLGRMNASMHKMCLETIFVNVANYIERQMQIRLKAAEMSESLPEPPKDELCSICFENMNAMATVTLKCLHAFHEKCLKAWIRQNNICPICRKFAVLE